MSAGGRQEALQGRCRPLGAVADLAYRNHIALWEQTGWPYDRSGDVDAMPKKVAHVYANVVGANCGDRRKGGSHVLANIGFISSNLFPQLARHLKAKTTTAGHMKRVRLFALTPSAMLY